jgi:hypothetical protein
MRSEWAFFCAAVRGLRFLTAGAGAVAGATTAGALGAGATFLGTRTFVRFRSVLQPVAQTPSKSIFVENGAYAQYRGVFRAVSQ